jgi:release factor glutamine methyltransferase
VARRNAAKILGIADAVNFVHADLFNSAEFSLIVSNPPYVPSEEIPRLSAEVRNEPVIALDGGPDGLDLIRRIVTESPEHLRSGGSLFLEADPAQMPVVTALMKSVGFGNIAITKDLAGLDRVIGGALA